MHRESGAPGVAVRRETVRTSTRHATGPGTADAADLAVAVERAMGVTSSVLQEFLDGRVRVAAGRSDVAACLWTDLAGVVGGKLMRPRLAVAAYLGLGGTDPAAVAPVAAAIEVLHTAMLVHDDLLDHDEVRRGRPNVAGATRARLAGRGLDDRVVADQVLAAGLLAGDLAHRVRVLAGAERTGGPVGAAARGRAAGRGHRDHRRRGAARRDRVAELAARRRRARGRGAEDRRLLGQPPAGRRRDPGRCRRRARGAAERGGIGPGGRVPADRRRPRRVRRPGGHRQVGAVGPARGQAHRAAAAGLRDGGRRPAARCSTRTWAGPTWTRRAPPRCGPCWCPAARSTRSAS